MKLLIQTYLRVEQDEDPVNAVGREALATALTDMSAYQSDYGDVSSCYYVRPDGSTVSEDKVDWSYSDSEWYEKFQFTGPDTLGGTCYFYFYYGGAGFQHTTLTTQVLPSGWTLDVEWRGSITGDLITSVGREKLHGVLVTGGGEAEVASITLEYWDGSTYVTIEQIPSNNSKESGSIAVHKGTFTGGGWTIDAIALYNSLGQVLFWKNISQITVDEGFDLIVEWRNTITGGV